MERERFRIEPIVFQRFSLCGADQTAFYSDFRINVEQNGQIRLESPAGEGVDAFEHIEIQSAGVSLIDHGRVEEAVGNDRDAFGELRFQQAFDHLGMTGSEEQKFRFRVAHALRSPVVRLQTKPAEGSTLWIHAVTLSPAAAPVTGSR